MELHKLCANHEKLSPDPEQNYNFATLTETKTLGVLTNLDCLLIKVKVCLDSSYTKRDVLSTIAKIFDPVGLMAPVISKAKISLQRLWRSKLEWNDLLPAEEYREWQQFLVSLENINNIEIPRRILVAFPEVIEIHGFADASERCYGAAVYCKSKNLKSETLVRLITSKSRVAPIKSLTIPRLELCAAVLLAKLVKRVVAALQLETAEVYLWSDSMIVLAWLRKEPMDLKTFVQNRVAKIQELYPNQLWRHVPSDQNPADLVSRGVDPEKLLQQNLWFNGPTFLSGDDYPNRTINCREKLDEYNSELKNCVNEQIENFQSVLNIHTTSSPRTGRIQIPVLELNDVQNQIPVRRSERLKSKLMSVHLVNNVPNSYFEAENSANWKNWKLAMENELDSLDKHKVWEIVQKPAKSKLIKTKWVYSLKQDDAGKNIKYKARLVAAGFNQIKNIDYSESYSPVVNIESFRLLIALAAKLKLNVNFFDVKTAYLYGDLEETVYVLPPPGYEKLIGDDKVCKLKKSIYGLPQSGRNWYMKIKGELENFGLKQLASDNCVFIKSVNQSVLILCMYVDDLAIFCNNDKMYEDIVSKIKNVFEVVENKTNKFLGMEIEKCENGIYLSQCDYINSLLVKHNLENCKSVKTPIVKGEDKIFPSTNEFIDITMYQELIGELLYLANRTRPDISFVISYLSQFNHNPEKRHYNLAKRVLRYLMGSKDKKLFYENEFGILNASSDAS
ncbi:retrovirus-related Pol polyprotein from transposon RE2 [Trichonephila clavipes]|uniref:Retrovirus-related Pol polyprotein from transposon RE2 n=1 Tax=Trichonephila clavipes TaxID=2585209 RepID=A0A8X6W1C3_TRICX|nr:retrovirus-related Pol polyprotein from transposon RE2 [Trichonephila clavipes]